MAVDGTPAVPSDGTVAGLVQEILSVVPAGCTWLLPVVADGDVVDFRIAAASDRRRDIYGRGAARVDERLSELYPSMVGGPLWQLYHRVMATGEAGQLAEFRYQQRRAGVVADSLFEVSVHRVLGGLMVWWQRLDENLRRLNRTEQLGNMGWAEYDLTTGQSDWSPGMYRIFERDPSLGPMSRAEQSEAVVPDDRGIGETAWQTLDTGAVSDVTVRFVAGSSVKYLRILSEVAEDADGVPVKIYALVQDITAREDSRSAIARLSDQLRTREMTALAEHRLAAQLQNMIQPVPQEPFPLPGLEVVVNYVPAESAIQVGGDWYHAQALPDGQVVLAIGDVAGHGLEAANGMAHLRFALVAWLSIGIRDPGLLLAHLNRLCRQLAITGTAVVAAYDPPTGTLRWARAGHPPPLLARAGGTDELERPPGMLLGAADDIGYTVVATDLRGDDLVLFYTDGLIERRGQSTLELLTTVKDTLSEVSTQSAAHPLRVLRGRLRYASPDDDTCTVAVRILPRSAVTD